MDKYFTLLDNRPEEEKPEDDTAVNQVGLAICPSHQARLLELGLNSTSDQVGDGFDGGMIAAIVIGVILLALVAYYIYRRRKAYE